MTQNQLSLYWAVPSLLLWLLALGALARVSLRTLAR
jgi:hypothetical protein